MNVRKKVNLALTVGLLNSNGQQNALQAVKELMSGFKDEVGAFLGLSRINNARLNQNHVKETYAIQFENCTLDVDLVFNPFTQTQVVQGFHLR
jgi:hypothetical protein